MSKWVMYVIIGLIVVAAVTHPAGAAGGMTAAGNVLTGESAILAGQGQSGGQKGSVNGVGSFY